MKVFEVKNINYSYFTGKKALNNVSFDIFHGEKVAILGPNGSGKTTLLSILNGLIFPNSGEIKFLGSELNEKNLDNPDFNAHFRKKVGYVFQNPDVQLFNPTVLDELLFGPLQLNLNKNETDEIIEKVVEIFSLEELLERTPFSLSHGEKKRVAIASVFMTSPDVILLDEPTTGLDPKNKSILINLIKKLNNDGKTVITATHDIESLIDIADRIVLFGENNSVLRSDLTTNYNNSDILSFAGLA